MQKKGFLKTVKSGDILIVDLGFSKRQVMVREVIGNLIEITYIDIREDLGEPPNAFDYEDEDMFCKFYSVSTGGVIDINLGLDGHKPETHHPYKELWSEIIAKL
jgi:hypothetical protein